MACKSCGARSRNTTNPAVSARQAPTAAPTLADIHMFDYTNRSTTSTRIRGGNGQYYAITAPLTRIQPPGGWGVAIIVNGHRYDAIGTTANGVVREAHRVYSINGIDMPIEQVWFNANIDWVGRVSIRHAWTTVADLLSIAAGPPETTVSDDPTPETWGGAAWRTMNSYIASENYSRETFIELASIVQSMLADPFIGCEECVEHFETHMSEFLMMSRGYSAYDAARWTFGIMNTIRAEKGKPQFTWEHAVAANRWERLVPRVDETDGLPDVFNRSHDV